MSKEYQYMINGIIVGLLVGLLTVICDIRSTNEEIVKELQKINCEVSDMNQEGMNNE